MKSVNKFNINLPLSQKLNKNNSNKQSKSLLNSNSQTIFSESNSETKKLSNYFEKTKKTFYKTKNTNIKNLKLTKNNSTPTINTKNFTSQQNSKKKKHKKLPKIKSQDELLSKIKTKILNEGPLFLTGEYKIKNKTGKTNLMNFTKYNFNKTKKLNNNFYRTLYLNSPNKLKNEFDLVELCQKFDEKKKLFQKKTISQKNKLLLNKLYGNTTQYIETMELARNKKYLPLAKYQENIIRAFNSNGEYSENIEDLQWKFKNLRIDSESVIPYPKINIQNIIDHVKNFKVEKNYRTLSLKEFLSKENTPRDEFEKEEKLINELRFRKNNGYLIHSKKRDNTFKVFDVLPPYLRKVLIKNRKGGSK